MTGQQVVTPALVLAPSPAGPDCRFTVLGPVIALHLAGQLLVPNLFLMAVQCADDLQDLPSRTRFRFFGTLKIASCVCPTFGMGDLLVCCRIPCIRLIAIRDQYALEVLTQDLTHM